MDEKKSFFETIKKAFRRKPPKLPEYGLLYFDLLHAEYCLLVPAIDAEGNAADKKRLEEIQKKREPDETLTWDDIYAYELTILKYQNHDTLKSKFWSLRERYREVAGQSAYDKYLLAKKDNAATAPSGETAETELRTDYTYLLREFCLLYSFMSAREELRNWLLKKGAFLTVVFLVSALLIMALTPMYNHYLGVDYAAYKLNLESGLFTLCVVAFVGMTGAFVSMQQRIQTAPSQGDPLYNLSILTHGSFGIFLSPLSGAIFAIILFVFFAGGLVQGEIFPNFKLDASINILSLDNFLQNTGPMGSNNYAKLLIWSFIAGFAERFVPDKLNKLVSDDRTVKAQPAAE